MADPDAAPLAGRALVSAEAEVTVTRRCGRRGGGRRDAGHWRSRP
ncbi:hypothetical protein [Nonomuraea polychroma]|nr:hypothetical protein [Nonomuraea polychroma]